MVDQSGVAPIKRNTQLHDNKINKRDLNQNHITSNVAQMGITKTMTIS